MNTIATGLQLFQWTPSQGLVRKWGAANFVSGIQQGTDWNMLAAALGGTCTGLSMLNVITLLQLTGTIPSPLSSVGDNQIGMPAELSTWLKMCMTIAAASAAACPQL